MKDFKIGKIEAGVIAIILLGSVLMLPMSGAVNLEKIENNNNQTKIQLDIHKPYSNEDHPAMRYDTIYIPKEDVNLAGLQNDIGYNSDAGDNIVKAFPASISAIYCIPSSPQIPSIKGKEK